MSDPVSPASAKTCPKCGTVLADGDVRGLCAACLMADVIELGAPRQHWEPPMVAELAALLPQYEIECLLGRGGMGAVYKGLQRSLDRPVAVKILPAEMEDMDPTFIKRFKNEARAMAKLVHPGIVAVFDSGETSNGLLYIVMEYVEGTDVGRMLAESGRLHTEHAMAITAHVCDALAYAHGRGIIHRDIKPANIMISQDGSVKVADFGLAKIHQGTESSLTQRGTVMGTLHYMAPEALTLGNGVDQRADIYAVGVMLYQMLTGKLPQGLFELPSMQIKGLDPRYDGIVARALREDRDLRYQHAVDMRHDLDAILTQPVVKAEEHTSQRPAAIFGLALSGKMPQPGSRQQEPAATSDPILRGRKRKVLLPWLVLSVICGMAALVYWGRDGFSEGAANEPAWIPSASLLPVEKDANAVWLSRWSRPGKLRMHGEGIASAVSIADVEADDDIVYVAGVPPGTRAGTTARWIALHADGTLSGTKVSFTQGQRYVGIVMGYNGAPDVVIREGGLPEAFGRLLRGVPAIQVRSFRMAALLGLLDSSHEADVFAFQNTDGTWSLAGDPVEKKLLALPDLSADRNIQNISFSEHGVAVVRTDGTSCLFGRKEVEVSPVIFSNVREVRFGKQIWYALGKNGVLTSLNLSPSGEPDYTNLNVITGVSELYGGHMGTYWRASSGEWMAHAPDQPIINKLNTLKPGFFFLALGPNGDLLFWIDPK